MEKIQVLVILTCTCMFPAEGCPCYAGRARGSLLQAAWVLFPSWGGDHM